MVASFRFTLTVVFVGSEIMPSENVAMSQNAASEPRNPARQGMGIRFTHAAADKWDDMAAYFRDRDINGLILDLGRAVKNYPGSTLIVASVVGFLLGRTLNRRE
jgi:hypothetical protein